MKYSDHLPRLREVLAFGAAGAINAVLTYLLYLLLLLFAGYKAAYSLSYVSGIFISYFLNSVFVFRERLSLGKALRFPLVYAVQYLAGLFLLYVLVEKAGMSEKVAPLLTMAATLPLVFFASRLIIRGRRPPGQESHGHTLSRP